MTTLTTVEQFCLNGAQVTDLFAVHQVVRAQCKQRLQIKPRSCSNRPPEDLPYSDETTMCTTHITLSCATSMERQANGVQAVHFASAFLKHARPVDKSSALPRLSARVSEWKVTPGWETCQIFKIDLSVAHKAAAHGLDVLKLHRVVMGLLKLASRQEG